MASGFLIFPQDWIYFGEGILDFFLDPFIQPLKHVLELLWNDVLAGYGVITDYIDTALGRLVNYIPNLDDIIGYVENVVIHFFTNQLPDLVSSLVGSAVDLATSVLRDTLDGITGIIQWVEDLAAEAESLARSAFDQVTGFLGGVEGRLQDWFDTILNATTDLVDQAVGDLTSWVTDAIDAIRRDLLPAIEDTVRQLFPFLDDLADLWNGVRGWLVFIARLPVDGIGAFEHLLADRLTFANVKGNLDHVPSWAGDIESAIAHVLG